MYFSSILVQLQFILIGIAVNLAVKGSSPGRGIFYLIDLSLWQSSSGAAMGRGEESNIITYWWLCASQRRL